MNSKNPADFSISGANQRNFVPESAGEIVAVEEVDNLGRKAKKFKGKSSIWPGAVALILLIIGSLAGITWYGYQLYNDTEVQRQAASGNIVNKKKGSQGFVISDGTAAPAVNILVENPDSYKDLKCELPNYTAENNLIVATYSNGKQIKTSIKGVNWFGMEVSTGVPAGLWNGAAVGGDGNNLYQIATFLTRNNFNAVRVPLSVQNVQRNIIPDFDLINSFSNAALNAAKDYRTLLGLFIQGLGQQSLAVVLDFHLLVPGDTTDTEGLWYNDAIHIEDTIDVIKLLADDLCNSKHWNVIGIDLKNAPTLATWGDGGDVTDWQKAATTLGKAVLKACPQWLVFVQGGSQKDSLTLPDGRDIKYYPWNGAGLSSALTNPVGINKKKVVYSPQYYTPSEKLMAYFFKDDQGTELDNTTLNANIAASMQDMYSQLPSKLGATVVLSQFGGIVGEEDTFPKQTSTRVFNAILKSFTNSSSLIAGGFLYAINPSTPWNYKNSTTIGAFNFGLVEDSWRVANMELLNILKIMDKTLTINQIGCVTGS